jgi:hypothetical protein
MNNMIKKCFFSLLLGLNALTFASFAYANDKNKLTVEPDVFALQKEFAKGGISSAQLAELALSKLDAVQNKLQMQLEERESACLDHFFTNSCLQEVRLKRRELQDILRAISIDAKSFLRRTRADKTKNMMNQALQ